MLRLQIATGILIVLVLPTDLAYSGFNRRQELVSWIDLVLVAFTPPSEAAIAKIESAAPRLLKKLAKIG
jgi:hypothetical protein